MKPRKEYGQEWSCASSIDPSGNLTQSLPLGLRTLFPFLLSSKWELQLRLSSIKIESEVLLVQPLLAEVKELELTCEVLPHYVFGCLRESCFISKLQWPTSPL